MQFYDDQSFVLDLIETIADIWAGEYCCLSEAVETLAEPIYEVWVTPSDDSKLSVINAKT